MKKEREYLAKTLEIIKNKNEKLLQKLSNTNSKFKKIMEEHGEDFRDLSRGGDLSNSFSELGLVENQTYQFEKEIKRNSLQYKSPYFARIDFTPRKKEKQQIYIGIGNVIDNGKLYVVDWRAPISSLY